MRSALDGAALQQRQVLLRKVVLDKARPQGLLAGLLLRGVGHGCVRKARSLRQLWGGVRPVGPGLGRGRLGRVIGHGVHLPVPDPSGTNWGLQAALVGLARWSPTRAAWRPQFVPE